jgi:hypothetical protein
MLAGQVLHDDWPILLNVPAGQVEQAAEELLPVDGLKVPATQVIQAAEELLPVKGLNVPEGHMVQAPE